MKANVIAAAVACTLLSTVALADQVGQSPWLVRARAVNVSSVNNDSTGLGLTVNSQVIPEVDISYFFNKNVSAELVLSVPQKTTLYSKGTSIGTLDYLPPTLLGQYHFDAGSFSPYVGAGLNYTIFSKVNLLGGAANVDNSSTGLALQAGVDVPLSGAWSLNLDVKKVYMKTGVTAGGANIGTFKLDPVLVGVGVGYRF